MVTWTSGAGSHAYLVGWAFILDRFSAESEIIKDLQRGNEPVFWIYIAFLAHCWVGSYYYQYVNLYCDDVDSDDNWLSV